MARDQSTPILARQSQIQCGLCGIKASPRIAHGIITRAKYPYATQRERGTAGLDHDDARRQPESRLLLRRIPYSAACSELSTYTGPPDGKGRE